MTDVFIKLEDARVNCDINDENCQLCMNFGDKIPYESADTVFSVGNGPNAAVSAHRLGLTSGLIVNIGDDPDGDSSLETFKKEGVSTELIRVHKGMVTNCSYVLMYEAERTILIKHETYPYAMPTLEEAPEWLYLTSVGSNSEPFHEEISAYLEAHPEVKLAFQPGTYQIKFGAEKLSKIYARAELSICNREEAQLILSSDSSEIKELIAGMHGLGVKQVIITDGPDGAYASDGTTIWHIPMYPDPAPPVDRTGAGDASASTTAAYLAQGLSLPEALKRGVINSMSVVQYIGAQEGLLTPEKIEEHLANAPADFVATEI